MSKKSREVILLQKHYNDMLALNKQFVETMRRPMAPVMTPPLTVPKRRKLSKKQLKALEDGRKILVARRRPG